MTADQEKIEERAIKKKREKMGRGEGEGYYCTVVLRRAQSEG